MGPLVKQKLVQENYWAIDCQDLMYDYEMPKFAGATDIAQAVIDTGTTLLGIPPDQHEYIVAMWKQTFGAEISCDNVVCFAPPQPDCELYTSRMKPV